jgi:hypothetical protein
MFEKQKKLVGDQLSIKPDWFYLQSVGMKPPSLIEAALIMKILFQQHPSS